MGDLFRADALRKLRDPQQLDTVVKLTGPSSWLALAALALVAAAVIAWGFLGALPFRVHGMGVLQQSESAVFALEAPGSGQVAELPVKVGDTVSEGQKLVVLSLPELEARRAAAERRLKALQDQRARQAAFTDTDVQERQANTAEQIQANEAKLAALRQRLAYLRDLERIESREMERQLITRDQLEQTRNRIAETQQEIAQTQVDIAQLKTEQAEYASRQRQQLDELDQQIIEAQAQLAEAQAQAEVELSVTSPVAGRVTEVDVTLGVRVDPGQQLLTVEQAGEGLVMYAYLPVDKGKRVQPGMQTLVSPTFVERDIYGSIVGRVLQVSELPVSRAQLRARFAAEDVVEAMMGGGPPIETLVALETDPDTASGLRWSSSDGPPVRITPGTQALAAVETRSERPVDLIVPLAQTWLGIGRSEAAPRENGAEGGAQ